jgi:hypothetical protein
VIKTRLTTEEERGVSIREEEIIYILPEASCLKAEQIGLAFP